MDLLINTFGTRIRSTGERIVLALPGGKAKTKKEYPIRTLEKIIILRLSSISTGAVQLALEAGVDIVYLNSFGMPVARIFPSNPKGMAALRKAQVVFSSSPKALELSRTLVAGKGSNQVAYLRQLQRQYRVSFSREILQCETMIDSLCLLGGDTQRGKLFGIEGYIADKYFSCLKKLHVFPGRKPQARDKFNSALNYGYGILYNEVERACLYVGLDPYLGHRKRRNFQVAYVSKSLWFLPSLLLSAGYRFRPRTRIGAAGFLPPPVAIRTHWGDSMTGRTGFFLA